MSEGTLSINGADHALDAAVLPAIANAIFAATGKRIREMPFRR